MMSLSQNWTNRHYLNLEFRSLSGMPLATTSLNRYRSPMSPTHPEGNHHQLERAHIPVLLEEVVHFLSPHSGGYYIDATIGLGGHAKAILEASSSQGKLLGIDRDSSALIYAAKTLSTFRGRFHLVNASFSDIQEIARQWQIESCDGILADLGVSSLQLESSERGFSFLKDGPLDMRMDPESSLTASEVVNHYPEKDLANLIFQYGEERRSRLIARAIVKSRPVRSTKHLADIVARALRFKGYQRIHPATRSFQALRIFVNDELGKIPLFIQSSANLLAKGGRIAIISFHSLEDRIVKDCFRKLSRECVCPSGLLQCSCGNKKLLKLLTKKPIQPQPTEVEANSRSRSAKLRVAEKL